MIFRDRQDAGQVLAKELDKLNLTNPLIVAIPRGGVIIAQALAEKHHSPINLILPRKIGSPINREVAIGAVTQDGTVIFDEYLMSIMGLTQEELAEDIQGVIDEINRRGKVYPNVVKLDEVNSRDVVLMDDGIATGYTIMAAIQSLKNRQPARLILAVPVAPKEVIDNLENQVDEVVCLDSPEDFYAVGQFYEEFDQVSDDEVLAILNSKQLTQVK
jgi:putative phosphoribosyl transferase